MKQSDWLRSLSERPCFLHPARSETQLPAVNCNCPLWFSRQKLRSETIFKRKIASSPKDFILSTMYTRIDNILIEMQQKVGKLFDMYKTYVEKTIYFLNAHVFGHLKSKKLQLKQIL